MSDAGGSGRLVELAVSDLGTIERVSLVLEAGMTALTGETGAGKTMVVGAIDLLLGGRADASLVRSGRPEAVVEGRFEVDGQELVLTRVIPADGRSRAYIDGRMATAAGLAERTASLVDLHGQHAHQSLLSARTQRDALDRYGDIDLGPLRAAKAEARRLEEALGSLGGDSGARARELDLLRFQAAELAAAALAGPDEDALLDRQEDELAGAVEHRAAAERVVALLTDEGGAIDVLGKAAAELAGRGPFEAAQVRLRDAQAEVTDLVADVRALGESIEDDPEKLAAVRERRQLLVDLRRKYATAALDALPAGSGTLDDVIAYHAAVDARIAALEGNDATAASLQHELAAAQARVDGLAAAVGSARRAAGPRLARAVEFNLAELAMASARIEVAVGAVDPGDDVALLLAANPGSEPAPLARVASGGELARAMLALRLVLSAAPPVLVFDEVDAGIGGQAAVAVGRALASLGRDHQILVVTHLPQVAAFADHQVRVHKQVQADATRSLTETLDHEARIGEISRMLSGSPDREAMRDAAIDLLARSSEVRGR